MSFIADKQTLDDLNLLGKYKSNSVYSLFNKVRTPGGEKLLDTMFRYPLTDVAAINRRSKIFQCFQEKPVSFPFDAEQFTIMENYLNSGGSGNRLTASMDLFRKKFMNTIGMDKDFETISAGLIATISLLDKLKTYLGGLSTSDNPFNEETDSIKNILSSSKLNWLAEEKNNSRLPLLKVVKYDTLLRLTLREEMTSILQFIYALDVFIAGATVANAKGFTNATALPKEKYVIRINDCRHPGLERAIANSVSLEINSNVLFLTGANMAGKSTFMKSFSISVYLAHMGFPVPASYMEFSLLDGMYTSINVPDNLQLGYSHFYAEVRRVKTVAEDVSTGKNLLVIFDELFKGTNVKDAYDATLAVTQSFAEYRNCFFIISTHIIEVADVLKKNCNNLQLVYFPTVMEGSIPRYTYRLQQGVTADRHGMMIIQNEGILGIIKGHSLV
jgi:DNA mismatch repair protein MutS